MRGTTTNRQEIDKIVDLRKKGRTISEIQAVTQRGRATILKYAKNVKILPRFHKRWENKQHSITLKRECELKRAKKQAKSLISKISKRDKLIIASCLYWGEGTKKDFNLSNTDPELIKTFINYIKYFGIKKKDLLITIRTYEDINRSEAIKYWATIIGIKENQIRNVNVLRGKKNGKLKYGMCRIRVRKGGYYLKLVKSIIEFIRAPRSSKDRVAHS